METKNIDILLFEFGKEFLLRFEAVDEKILNKNIFFESNFVRPESLNDVYKRILETSQNANMHPGVINGTIGSISNLKNLLFDFDVKKINNEYPEISDSHLLLKNLLDGFKLSKYFRTTPKSIITKLCITIISAAIFINQFENSEEFFIWIDKFDQDEKLRPALPMILSYEIYGLGFALSCNFLKELGYLNFGKPDVHIKDIFTSLNLSKNRDDYTILKSIIRMAKNNGVYPYTIDKLFWLIGSGNFDKDNINIGTKKKEFIELAKNKFKI